MGDGFVTDVLDYLDPASASVVLLNSSSRSSYCSACDQDHFEREDSKLPEVIYIDDSPQIEVVSSVSGDSNTPCPSVYEDDGLVEEIFSSDPSHCGVEQISNKEILNNGTVRQEETNEDYISRHEEDERQSFSCSMQSKFALRNFTVPCLESITSLKKRFELKHELNFKLRRVAGVKTTLRKRLYKFKKDLHQKLDDWEAYLNDRSPNEAYIAVENTVDNEGPPDDFIYITHNILHQDIRHLFDVNYLVGCSCQRFCTMDICECPRNSGGEFAYDRTGRVRVEPGTPIYECNSQCPCSLSCRNRVVQRGRTVKVSFAVAALV